jgi:uncharacterized RDD family membrane protein YckC
MTTTIDDYINRVMAAMPQATPERSQIALELRGHIAERMQSGTPADEVLRQLGDPVALAEQYLSAVPLVAAPFGARILAKVIDVALVLMFMAALAGLLVQPVRNTGWLFPFALLIVIVGGSFAFAIYTIASEASTGETVGKRAMHLRVVQESGAQITWGQAILRQLPIVLQVAVFDALFALFTEKRQRAFEVLSKTRVVKDRLE